MKRFVMIVPLLLSVACGGEGGGNEITGPSATGTPSVAGNYSGNTTISFPEQGTSVSCPTTTNVTQSGSTVSIAPLQLSGACAAQGMTNVPMFTTTINNTGSLGSESGTTTQSCGTYNYTASGGFVGRQLQVSLVYTSRACWNMNVTINLTR